MTGIMQGRLTPSEKLDFFPFDNWENEFPLARKIGFDAIEWGFARENWNKNPIMTKEGVSKIKHLVRKYEVFVQSICAYYFVEQKFDELKAKNAINVLNLLIQQGARIGARRIILPFLGKAQIFGNEQKNKIVGNLKRCLETAEKHGIELALESCLPAEEFMDFIKQFKSPLVKICYDTGNCTTHFGKETPSHLEKLGKMITEVHIKDKKFNEAKTYPLGEGETDFDEIFKVLKTMKFNGPFVLEAARCQNIDDIALNKSYLKLVKKYLEGEK